MIKLGICLCFKDSATYLEEWLAFHYVQGFRKFYLYDNESSDNYRPILQPWVDRGLVELIVFPGTGIQAGMYDDCLRRARERDAVEWLAFIDDDEFIYPVGDETLEGILDGFAHTAGLAVNWVLYGSSGQQQPDGQWVIKRFTRSSGGPDHHFKCIVRPQRIRRSQVIGHQFEPIDGYQVLTEGGEVQPGPRSEFPSARKVRVNHYLIRSWSEWRTRRSRAQADTGVPTPLPEAFWRQRDEQWSQVEDASALRFVPQMEAVLRELR